MRKIKGFVTYVYRGVQYFERPKKTYISKIEYDEINNMSTVYLKHDIAILELLCIAVLCCLIYFVFNMDNYVQAVYLPEDTYCFSDRLYLNMIASENNKYPVRYDIAGYSGVLNPGDSLDYVDYVYDNQTSELITYTVSMFGMDMEFEKRIPVTYLEPNYGGSIDEGY